VVRRNHLSMSSRLVRLVSTFVLLCAGLLLLEMNANADGVTLRIANYGGNFTQSQNQYVAERFTANTGIKIEWIDGNPRQHVQKLIASRGRAVPFDVVYLDDTTQPDAEKVNMLMKLDPAIVTNLSKIYDEAKNPDGYGPAMLFWSWGLLYNEKIFKEQGIPEPQSWNDLWDPRLAGRVAIADVGGPGGIDFIVMMAKLTGGDEKNVTPGLNKIKGLKTLYYFNSSVDLRSKFQSGDVWIAPWNNGQSNALIDTGFPGKFIYPKEGGFLHTTTIDVVAGSEHPKEAMQFINYVLDPLSQLGQSYAIPYGPVNKSLAGVMQAYPELSKKFPASEADVLKLNRINWLLVDSHLPEIVDQWNRLVVHQ
jgi:putative spermidine/putrescine transport system substrate-binding protein